MNKLIQGIILSIVIFNLPITLDSSLKYAHSAPTHEKVTTDKTVYHKGDTIIVTGSVPPTFYSSNMMRIDLYKGFSTWINETFVQTDDKGYYQAEIAIPKDTFPGADYHINVYHAPDGRQWDESASFTIKD